MQACVIRSRQLISSILKPLLSMCLIGLVALTALTALPVMASELQINLKDNTQQALSNVVIEIIPADASTIEALKQSSSISTPDSKKTMQQLDQQFVPHVLAVQQGTEVEFPETDTVQHHVYSFSPAKVFEIAIYKEDLKRNILFDKAGIVELGCNIHDWMLGYIYVANSALFAQTDKSGAVRFIVPEGQYDIKVWHPRIQQSDIDTPRHFHYQHNDDEKTTFHTIVLKENILSSYTEYDDVHGLSEY